MTANHQKMTNDKTHASSVCIKIKFFKNGVIPNFQRLHSFMSLLYSVFLSHATVAVIHIHGLSVLRLHSI